MSKILKTKIDNIPVELEIKNIGPATREEIRKLSNSLAEEAIIYKEPTAQVKVVKVGSEEHPVSEADIQKVEDQINNAPELVMDLIESFSNVEEGKNWYESKTVWVNVLAIVGAITATFGLPVHIDPELAMTVYPLLLGAVNIFLRKTTKKPLKSLHKKQKIVV